MKVALRTLAAVLAGLLVSFIVVVAVGLGLSTSKIPKGQVQEGRQTEQRGRTVKFFKRTINIIEDRKAKDDVNPAKNRTLVALFMIGL